MDNKSSASDNSVPGLSSSMALVWSQSLFLNTMLQVWSLYDAKVDNRQEVSSDKEDSRLIKEGVMETYVNGDS